MSLPKEVLRALVYFVIMQLSGCASVGWLPSLSLALAGIDRTKRQSDQTARKQLILKAEARFKWKILPDVHRSLSQPIEDRRTAISDIGFRTRRTSALREWESRERNRVIDQTNRGWRP